MTNPDSFSPTYVPAWVRGDCLGGRRCRLTSVVGTLELIPASVADHFLLPLGIEVTTVQFFSITLVEKHMNLTCLGLGNI